ncbi:MAG TPA: hypothetical protein VGM63_14155 [Mucilaginibacter sp.]
MKIHYYEVGMKSPVVSIRDSSTDWRDTSFIIATTKSDLITAANAELNKPVQLRKNIIGDLVRGNGGYNKNGSYKFTWHFNENTWQTAAVSAELYDGRPYTDLDLHSSYWLDTVKRYCSWSSYIKREIK